MAAPSSSSSSLDALLDKIQSDSTLRLSEDPATPPVSVSLQSGYLSEQAMAQNAVTAVQDRNELWESNLTPRQKALPKIPSQMLGGFVAIMILMVGIGSATLLTQQNQDLRQQASEGSAAQLAGTSATLTQAEYEASLQEASGQTVPSEDYIGAIASGSWTQTEMLIVAVAAISIVVILALLVWIFFF